jgi:hypothetical protein
LFELFLDFFISSRGLGDILVSSVRFAPWRRV